MRGKPFFNFPAFDAAASELREYLWTIHSPAEKDRDVLDVSLCPTGSDAELEAQNFSLAGALTWDFARIAESDCVVFLPGWEKSTGCNWEATVAYALGKPVLQYPALSLVTLPRNITHPCSVVPTPAPTVEYRTLQDLGPLGKNVEVRVIDPQTGGAKGSKLARFDLLPWDVIWEDAELYGAGSQKYEDRNWEKGYAWGLSIAALGRHLTQWLSGEDTDPETGVSHLVAVRWHAGALRWFEKHGKGTDDRAA